MLSSDGHPAGCAAHQEPADVCTEGMRSHITEVVEALLSGTHAVPAGLSAIPYHGSWACRVPVTKASSKRLTSVEYQKVLACVLSCYWSVTTKFSNVISPGDAQFHENIGTQIR